VRVKVIEVVYTLYSPYPRRQSFSVPSAVHAAPFLPTPRCYSSVFLLPRFPLRLTVNRNFMLPLLLFQCPYSLTSFFSPLATCLFLLSSDSLSQPLLRFSLRPKFSQFSRQQPHLKGIRHPLLNVHSDPHMRTHALIGSYISDYLGRGDMMSCRNTVLFEPIRKSSVEFVKHSVIVLIPSENDPSSLLYVWYLVGTIGIKPLPGKRAHIRPRF
jgi:hypothetical protein